MDEFYRFYFYCTLEAQQDQFKENGKQLETFKLSLDIRN